MNDSPSPKLSPGRSSSRRRGAWGLAAGLALVGLLLAVTTHFRNGSRRQALGVLGELERSLRASELTKAVPLLHLPANVAARSSAEKEQWIAEVLRDEVSGEGLEALRRGGDFGPLREVFPSEAERWAQAARLPLEACVGIRMERAGIRAEVVLHQTPAGYRIVRCNNVKQMASVRL